jgi:hypothetical protein
MAAKKKPAISGLHSQGIIDDIFKAGGKKVINQVRRDVRKAVKSSNAASNVIKSGAMKHLSKATGDSIAARQAAAVHFAEVKGIKQIKRTNQTQDEWEKEWKRYWNRVNRSGYSKAVKEETDTMNAKRLAKQNPLIKKNAGKVRTK